MGEVYRAHDVRLGRPVALKVLAEGVAGDERFRDRMLRESRLAASLDHPNVVPMYEAGEHEERLFIAMRYVRGGDLKGLLRRGGALDAGRAVAICAQLADALDAAHRGASSIATSSPATSSSTRTRVTSTAATRTPGAG